jgi:hypothetical protein
VNVNVDREWIKAKLAGGGIDGALCSFTTKQLSGGIQGGLSFRRHLPAGRSFTTVSVADIPPPQVWGSEVYFIAAENVSGLMKEVLSRGDQLSSTLYYRAHKLANSHPGTDLQLHYFRCYSLPDDAFPAGFQAVQDNCLTAGHVTLRTTSPQAGKITSVFGNTRICPAALENLPWRLDGYLLCPGAEVQPREKSDELGLQLIATLCAHQSILTLDQLESLRVLVTATEYTWDALVAYLPPAAAIELQYGARLDLLDEDEWDIIMDYYYSVEELAQVRAH